MDSERISHLTDLSSEAQVLEPISVQVADASQLELHRRRASCAAENFALQRAHVETAEQHHRIRSRGGTDVEIVVEQADIRKPVRIQITDKASSQAPEVRRQREPLVRCGVKACSAQINVSAVADGGQNVRVTIPIDVLWSATDMKVCHG
jgi:hypothetical protein